MPVAKVYVTCSIALLVLLSVVASVASTPALGYPQSRQRRLNGLLLDTASRNDYAGFRKLLMQGADPNTPQYFNGYTRTKGNSSTYLMWFATLGDAVTVQALLAHGANVNARGWTCFTAMGHGEPNPHRSTALIDACCRSDNRDVIRLLLRYGADVNARDSSGNTSLAMAVWQSEWEECRLLLHYGARRDLLTKQQQEDLRRSLSSLPCHASLLLSCAPTVTSAAPQTPPFVSPLLSAKTIQYTRTNTATHFYDKDEPIIKVSVYHLSVQQPDKYAETYTLKSSEQWSEAFQITSDGKKGTTYYPDIKEYRQGEPNPPFRDEMGDVEEDATIPSVKPVPVLLNGRRCLLFTITERKDDGLRSLHHLWLDAATLLPLRGTWVETQNGKLRFTAQTNYTDWKVNTPLPASLFIFVPPPGAKPQGQTAVPTPSRPICSADCLGEGMAVHSQQILDSRLGRAVADDQIEAVKYWLAEGANANTKVPKVEGNPEMVGQPLIIAAAQMHNIGLLKLLLNYGANVNARWVTPIECECYSGERILETPLIDAAATVDVDEVKLLLERGADARISPGGSEGKTLSSYVRAEYPKQFQYAPGDVGGGRMPDENNVEGRYEQIVVSITASLQQQKRQKVTVRYLLPPQ